MNKQQKFVAVLPAVRQQFQQLFFTTRDCTAAETIMKVAMGPLALWACLYSVLPWILG